MDFSNKVVIITGASAGIGASCAVLFAKASAKLAIVGRNAQNLAKTAQSCQEASGETPLSIIADMTIDEDVKSIVDQTVKRFGQIDVLVNNAGMSVMANIENGMDAFDRVMATNLRGTVLLTVLAMPHLIETKGNVVNISSILANEPLSVMAAYCMSKAAMNMFTKCAAQEFGPKGVRVNAVSPGPVKTDILQTAGMTSGDCDTFFEAAGKMAPLRKVTYGDDCAELVLFIASEKASCITGSFQIIDCGTTVTDRFRM